MTAIHCPCCGVAQFPPKPPRVDQVPWGDCACSDSVMCMAHRLGADDVPPRPTDAALAEKGQRIYVQRLKDFAEMILHFEEHE
jgi:hypothetical protein